MLQKKFQKRVEDFTCEHCHTEVKGDGYTNHCPQCLWSKHVDVNPGDRANDCGGMMEPLAVEGNSPKYRIVERCQKCREIKHFTMHKSDNPNAIIAIAERTASRAARGLPALY